MTALAPGCRFHQVIEAAVHPGRSIFVAVVVRGHLTGQNVDIVRRDLMEMLDSFTGPELVLDLTDVSELDDDGLEMLFGAQNLMQARGQSLALKGLRHAPALIPEPRTAPDSLIGRPDVPEDDNVVTLRRYDGVSRRDH